MIENIDEVVYLVDVKPDQFVGGTVRFVSPNVRALLGYEPQQFMDDSSLWFRSLHPDDMPPVLESTKRIFAQKAPATRLYRVRHRTTGEYHWFDDKVLPRLDANGEIAGLFGVARCVTHEVLAREALQASEARFRQLVESSPDAILLVATDGRITTVNGQAENLFGYERKEVVDQRVELLIPERSRDHHAGLCAAYARDPRMRPMGVKLSLVARRKDGSEFPVEISLSPIVAEEGLLTIVTVRDVTERVAFEDQLRQSQKMDSIGRLAGGVAHDFNNLLTVILGCAAQALEHVGPDNPSRTALGDIQQAAERAAALTHQLLAFSRRQILQPAVIDLNELVSNIGAMLKRLIPEDIEIVLDLAMGLGHVKADSNQIEQVLTNLAVNARDAMPRGGRLTISTTNVDLEERQVTEHLRDIPPGPYVSLAVADTGVGMDPDTRAHVFEPFFTTKDPGEGTGLGLSSVYGIVQQSGGYIWVGSERGRGTRFEILLPRIDRPTESVPVAHPPKVTTSEASTVASTILLVEDEDAVRELIARVLEREGHHVLKARHGAEAIVMSRAHTGPIDLLMTDIMMPRAGGSVLAEHLSQDRPTLRVLYTCAHTASTTINMSGLDPGVALLEKPFTPARLAAKVREVLAGPVRAPKK